VGRTDVVLSTDASVDVMISNGVINLATDKPLQRSARGDQGWRRRG
jgi:hypothetical protein